MTDTSGPIDTDLEFLKHLRLTHFTLVTIALVLCIAALPLSQPLLETARNDLQKLTTVYTSLESIIDDYITGIVDEHAVSWPKYVRVEFKTPNGNDHHFLLNSEQLLRHVVLFERGLGVDQSCQLIRFRTPFDETPWQRSNIIEVKKSNPDSISAAEMSETWDCLEHTRLAYARQTDLRVRLILGASESVLSSVFTLTDEHGSNQERSRVFPTISHHRVDLDRRNIEYVLTLNINEKVDSSIDRLIMTLQFDHVNQSHDLELLRHIVDRYFPTHHSNSFSDTFPALSEFIGEGRVNRSLTVLSEDLELLAKSESKSFPILGAQIPTEYLSLVGTLLLLGVQCYFYFHLRQYRALLGSRIMRTADFPWVGIYPGRSVFAVLFITYIGMPLIAMIFVTARFADTLPVSMRSIGPLLGVLGSVFVTAIGLGLLRNSYEAHRLRKGIADASLTAKKANNTRTPTSKEVPNPRK